MDIGAIDPKWTQRVGADLCGSGRRRSQLPRLVPHRKTVEDVAGVLPLWQEAVHQRNKAGGVREHAVSRTGVALPSGAHALNDDRSVLWGLKAE